MVRAIIGIGNPGLKYANTRHNIGFRVLEALRSALGGHSWQDDKGIEYASYLDRHFLLIKPKAYVNETGEAIGQWLKYSPAQPEHLWVIHDDVEVPFGEIRIKQGGGSGGHNGIKSLDEAIGPDYWRIRIGVGRGQASAADLADYVLAPFTAFEEKELPSIIDRAVSYLIQSIDEQNLTTTTIHAKEKHEKN
jgi:PTH1 family peptidyl-tRNA hydrolase